MLTLERIDNAFIKYESGDSLDKIQKICREIMQNMKSQGIVMTGKAKTLRVDIETALKDAGVPILKKVSSRHQFLVTNDLGAKSVKASSAEEHQCTVLTYELLAEILFLAFPTSESAQKFCSLETGCLESFINRWSTHDSLRAAAIPIHIMNMIGASVKIDTDAIEKAKKQAEAEEAAHRAARVSELEYYDNLETAGMF